MKRIARFISALLTLAIVFSAVNITALGVYADSPSLRGGIVTTSGGRLNVRNSPSTSASKLTQLINKTEVTLVEKNGNWWKICYGSNKYGYVSADYIKVYEDSYEAKVTTAGGRLNVRSGGGTGYSVKAQLNNGSSVVVLSKSGSWSRILYNGISYGYVSSSYLSQGDVKLSVPSFKQNDSRWARVKLGNYGKNIGQIGCALTCLSMTESYRTGTTVYPSEMKNKLTFSADGSLYWPTRYVHNYGSGYLSTMKSILDSGRPVILCAKTSAGSTHFVVVTGYRNNGSLSADDFYINDPGSKTRDTLNELFNVYPRFYKLVYYS